MIVKNMSRPLLYPLLGPPGPLTPHVDAPQLGMGLEKPFLTPCQSDWKLSRTNAKYRMDRFRAREMNQLTGPTQLQRQYFTTSYATPCLGRESQVKPSLDASIEPQCSTCLKLLRKGHRCISENNMWPNGAISEVAVNASPECEAAATLALNECGVQCGQPRNYETTSVSCWPKPLVAALSM
jgi:hypothetical protein